MSERYTKALVYAANAHEGQLRKIDKSPYIFHPLEVSAIINTLTDNEDVAIAGLLHDTVEDCGTTYREIEENFGIEVSLLVASESEDKRADLPPDSTWKIRKAESLNELKNASDRNVKILWLADKLSNMRSMYRYYKDRGDALFEAFHQKDKKEHEWYYRKIAQYTEEFSYTAAYEEFVMLIDAVFSK